MKIKNWYQSKTIWGVVIAALGFFITNILGVDGIALPENPDFDALKKYAEEVEAAKNNVGSLIGSLVSALGYVLAIVGRIKADTEIKLGGIKPIKPVEQ